MLTSAVLVQITVQQRQHVQTLMAATLVPVTLDMMEMEQIASVRTLKVLQFYGIQLAYMVGNVYYSKCLTNVCPL